MSVCSCPVNIMANPTLGVLSHQAIQPPMPAPVINPSVEMLTFQLWVYGYVTNKNKFSKKNNHRGQWIVQNGHDCGMLIPDITIPIVGNLLYLIHWPFSKGAIAFGASTVKIESQPTACAALLPPFPMMTCGQPVGAPTRLSYLANLNNVKVGMTFLDILAGVLAIALSIIIDLIFNKITAGTPGTSPLTSSQILRSVVLPGVLGKFGPMELLKSGVSATAGLLTSSLTGDPTYKLGYGAPPIVGAEFSIVTNRDTGQTQTTLTGEAVGVQGDTAGNRSVWGTDTPAPSSGSGGTQGGNP